MVGVAPINLDAPERPNEKEKEYKINGIRES
jgi:hypothetical protein